MEALDMSEQRIPGPTPAMEASDIPEQRIPGQALAMEALDMPEIWKISEVAAFMDQDNDHLNFRRFRRLNIYCTLALQHRLIKLDERLGKCERSERFNGTKELLSEASELLEKYGTLDAVGLGLVLSKLILRSSSFIGPKAMLRLDEYPQTRGCKSQSPCCGRFGLVGQRTGFGTRLERAGLRRHLPERLAP
jgi:hypothetical protein